MPIKYLPNGDTRAMCAMYEMKKLTPEIIIKGYAQGIFPAPDMETLKIKWFDPNPRGVFPINDYKIPRRLKQTIRKGNFEIHVNKDFVGVLKGCADRPKTWLLPSLIEAYTELHQRGVAHSIEVWQEDRMIGGLFGLNIGSYFVGISQFHYERDAGKIATAYLLEILKANNFLLNDCGWTSPFLDQFGCIDVPRKEFHAQHAYAIVKPATFKMIDFNPFE